VIGDDGFGYNQIPDTARGRLYHVKNEHVGGVWIGDDVEIGTLVCVDRGLVGDTVIGSGTKVDNLVQIAHNCQVGRDAVIVAQVGMAGHTRLGDRVFALGQAGFTTGAAVGDDAIIGGQAGVSGEIPAGRAVWSGTPAQKADDDFRQLALIRRELPRVREFFRLLGRADSFQSLQQMFKAVRNRGKEDKA
jgi:UDP-3-O-[3-hydroxymyristoyl] glucosamine N-acyltransferase